MEWVIAKGSQFYTSGTVSLISPFSQPDEVSTIQNYNESVEEINQLYEDGAISTYEKESLLAEAEFNRTHSMIQTRVQTQKQYERTRVQPTKSYQEQGYLTDFNSIDIECGIEENSFVLAINKVDSMKMGIELGDFIYCEGTEFGGMIDGRQLDTADEEILWTGTTFRGLIQQDIIRPKANQDYRTVSGDANTILRTILTENGGAGSFLNVPQKTSGCTVTSYQFPRYCNKLSGLKKMLETYGYRLKIYTNGQKGGAFGVYAEAVPIQNLSAEVEFSQDDNKIDITMTEDYSAVNHLICLGDGELASRTVVDLYIDKKGKITTSKTSDCYTGVHERIEVYDYGNVEGETATQKKNNLITAGKTKLTELNVTHSMELTVDQFEVEIGDIIAGKDRTTGFEMSKAITSKIVRVEADGTYTIELSVDGNEESEEGES